MQREEWDYVVGDG